MNFRFFFSFLIRHSKSLNLSSSNLFLSSIVLTLRFVEVALDAPCTLYRNYLNVWPSDQFRWPTLSWSSLWTTFPYTCYHRSASVSEIFTRNLLNFTNAYVEFWSEVGNIFAIVPSSKSCRWNKSSATYPISGCHSFAFSRICASF